MKQYFIFISLLTMAFMGCDSIERYNVNNPNCCMLDSISIHYYITTQKNELTTTYRQ